MFLCSVATLPSVTNAAQENDVAYKLALSKQLAGITAAVEFYQQHNFEPIWIDRSRDAGKRLLALQSAFDDAVAHGLPVGMFDAAALQADIRAIRTSADLGRIEGKITRAYLSYAQMIQFGVLVPGSVDEEIKRKRKK